MFFHGAQHRHRLQAGPVVRPSSACSFTRWIQKHSFPGNPSRVAAGFDPFLISLFEAFGAVG